MNAVMDLAARAVSFITIIQDTVLSGSLHQKDSDGKINIDQLFTPNFPVTFQKFRDESSGNCQEQFRNRATELVWISKRDPDRDKAVAYTDKLCEKLAEWIVDNKTFLFAKFGNCGSLPAPNDWRTAIVELLYINRPERVRLATALEYLPIQIVLALGGGNLNVRNQRILQLWKVSPDDLAGLLSPSEIAAPLKSHQFTDEHAEALLLEEIKLLGELVEKDVPLPFELIFKHELEEITANRKLRYQEQCLTNQSDTLIDRSAEYEGTLHPFEKAKKMELYALAFSGGGIRSATFNLGILQGLAKKGLISKFDYLSTVSGGGYIGSWLAAWIKREGSVTKVTDRLNPNKSPDPFGEELWPIRWLRMFSNYFTPRASIMSLDSWTVGVTWLRNMLLNQVIILLLLLSMFLCVRVFYELWINGSIWVANDSTNHILLWSFVFFLPVSLLSGAGMRSYHGERFPPLKIKRNEVVEVSNMLLIFSLLGAFVISAALFHYSSDKAGDTLYTFQQKLLLLKYDAIVFFSSLVLIAIYGRYDKCMTAYKVSKAGVVYNIFISALLSTVVGVIGMALAWELLEVIKQNSKSISPVTGITNHYALAFTIGVPLMLIVMGLIVVTRMAILGKYFPDERREWWGRMGAAVNRVSFIFILLAGSSLIGYMLLNKVLDEWVVATAGGWVALVMAAVRAAFSAKSSGKEEANKTSLAQEILSKAGPYIFAAGLLFFIPALLPRLVNYNNIAFAAIGFPQLDIALKILILTVIIFAGTYLLARRVGVNEFSMHHFYRNRLVRAFLGATRRRAERQSSSNPFTNFDAMDDIKISLLRNERNYYGPYPILNTALNASQVSQLDRQDRKAESFIFSPLYCGFDFSMARANDDVNMKSYDYGYRKTECFAYKDGGPGIGTAMAISGAAINPNQGYHSSSAIAFLLTVFNVQMGWWIGNPRKNAYRYADPRSGLAYIIYNLTGKSNTKKDFVSLSDGGHFDNMGLYEMVRRRVSFIILGDAEQDEKFTCEGLANAIRRCRIDFGAEIMINTDKITNRDEKNFSQSNYAIGTIKYAGDETPTGKLLYIKSSITDKVPVDVREYALKNKTFPHQTTGDQFFDEEQFESYRRLGMCIADLALADEEVNRELKLLIKEENSEPEVKAPDDVAKTAFANIWQKGSSLLQAYIVVQDPKTFSKGPTTP